MQAYFATINAFFSLNIVFLPKAFKSGGLLFSILFLLCIAILSAFCALKLIQCGLVFGTDSYQKLVKQQFGKRSHNIFLFFLAGYHFIYTLT